MTGRVEKRQAGESTFVADGMDAAGRFGHEQVRTLAHDASVLLVSWTADVSVARTQRRSEGRTSCLQVSRADVVGEGDTLGEAQVSRCTGPQKASACPADVQRDPTPREHAGTCMHCDKQGEARRGQTLARSNRGTRRDDIHTGGSGVRTLSRSNGATDDGPTRTNTGQVALERRIGS